ncbi:MAG: hypothetical protein KF893_18045 [Caldilineaceae bacterium]|nr:hypothetical protein [Caldilineaceae bacterium]
MLNVIPIRQDVATEKVHDVAGTVRAGLGALPLSARIRPGMKVAVGVGSRGISSIGEVVRVTVEALLALGAKPFLVPAMGSHGGGTAEGQRQVLEGYGLGEADLGIPIRSSLDTVIIGETAAGMPVYFDAHAAQADAILVVNRIKPHTSFRARWESGLFKILAVGLGKQRGAETIHAWGIAEAIPAAARVILARMPVVAGIGIVENGHHEAAHIAVIPAERLEEDEPPLLEIAKSYLPRIPLQPFDLMIVQEIGKNISGTGMDLNIVGMWRRNGGPVDPLIRRLVVLDLTEASHGNATGIGYADLIPARLRDKVDWPATYMNCLTAGNYPGARIPITLPTDQAVIETGLAGFDIETARIVYIRNTLDLEIFWVSPALLAEVEAHPHLTAIGESQPIRFDPNGLLCSPAQNANPQRSA